MAKQDGRSPPKAEAHEHSPSLMHGKGAHTFRSAANGQFFTKHAPTVSIARVERAFERASGLTGAFKPKKNK